jgi:hypothetical protein
MADDTVVLPGEQRRTDGDRTSYPTAQSLEESSFADRYLEYTFDNHRRPKRLSEQGNGVFALFTAGSGEQQ